MLGNLLGFAQVGHRMALSHTWRTAARSAPSTSSAEYLDPALRYSETKRFPPLEQRAPEMWEPCVSTIENDPLKLDREVDWVIKFKLLEAFRDRHGLPLGHPRVQLLDLQYHDVSRGRSPFCKLQDSDLVERLCRSCAAPAHRPGTATSRPPPTSRLRRCALACAASSCVAPRSPRGTTRSIGSTAS
jgi:hypothetical protein